MLILDKIRDFEFELVTYLWNWQASSDQMSFWNTDFDRPRVRVAWCDSLARASWNYFLKCCMSSEWIRHFETHLRASLANLITWLEFWSLVPIVRILQHTICQDFSFNSRFQNRILSSAFAVSLPPTFFCFPPSFSPQYPGSFYHQSTSGKISRCHSDAFQ